MVAWHDEQKYLAAFSLLGFVACYATVIMSWLFKGEPQANLAECPKLTYTSVSVAMNVGCILFAFFVGTPCLIQFVNIMLLWDNTDNKAPVWCDISESHSDYDVLFQLTFYCDNQRRDSTSCRPLE